MHNKLSKCKIEANKKFLIQTIKEASTKDCNKLEKFKELFHITDLKNATNEQLQDFILDNLQ